MSGNGDINLSLKDFLEGYPPPQSGRIVDGLPQDIQDQSGIDLGRGTILKFHRKVNPNVPVSFRDPWGGDSNHFIKVTLPIDFPGKFCVLAFDPASGDHSEDHIFHTVADLITAFPVLVQANASHGNKTEDPASAIHCGDRLKLIRLIYKEGVKLLECRRERETRLLTLPMSCVGDFTVVPNNNEYLLADLVSLLPRKRRVKLCPDASGKLVKIPGLPSGFDGDIFVDELEYFVEASPLQDEGLIIGLPHDLDMIVSPGDFERGLLLNSFATNNRNLFPVVACVTDWDEETTILENHFIKPGVELCIHGWTRQSKILAKSAGRFYAIPLTYQGRFCIQPQQFSCVADLEHVHPGYKLRVLEVDISETNFPLVQGDIIKITRGDSMKKGKVGEVKYLKCERYSLTGTSKIKIVKLPISAKVKFEEILEDTRNQEFHIKELVSFVSDQAVNVSLKKGSPDQKVKFRDLPFGETITLCDFVIEPAIYVSVDTPEAPAFHVPLRTLIYVNFVEQLDKNSSPLLTKINPKLSTLDRCIEILPDDIFQQLLRKAEESNHLSNFNGTSSIHGPSSPTAWNGSPRHWSNSNSSRKNSLGDSDNVRMSTLPTNQRKEALIARKYRSTENIFKASHGQEASLSLPRAGSTQELTVSVPTVATHVPQHSPSSPVSRDPTARIYSAGNGQTVYTHSGESSQYNSLSRNAGPTVSSTVTTATVNGGSLHGSLPSSPVPVHNNSLPDGSAPDNVQLPPGYVLMPTAQAQAIPAGYTLVPVWGGSTAGSVAGSHMGSLQRLPSKAQRVIRIVQAPSVIDDDSDIDDMASDISRFTFSKQPNFKVTIPPDGNLYHFSVKKFCELLRLLKIEEPYIRACLKDKIDGKKFSRMHDVQMERYGIMHPIMLHFRRHTDKKKASSKFQL